METFVLSARADEPADAKRQKNSTMLAERFMAGKEYIRGASPLERAEGPERRPSSAD